MVQSLLAESNARRLQNGSVNLVLNKTKTINLNNIKLLETMKTENYEKLSQGLIWTIFEWDDKKNAWYITIFCKFSFVFFLSCLFMGFDTIFWKLCSFAFMF